jgi:hypothetical protein
MKIIKTGSGGIWDVNKSIRTSMKIANPKLTGKFEDHVLNGETVSMLEVDHDFDKDFIFEEFLSQ